MAGYYSRNQAIHSVIICASFRPPAFGEGAQEAFAGAPAEVGAEHLAAEAIAAAAPAAEVAVDELAVPEVGAGETAPVEAVAV